MTNLVLYRKYRPQKFSEFIGQEHIVKTLTNAILEGMVSHAYLFSGPRGSGKTTLARLLAKAVNCEKRKGFEPCDQCSSCKEITQGRAIDLIEIDAASHRGIDEIRELKNGIRFGPTKSKYKVFIIDESHMLTREASNALLKTLEEPPSNTIFILATTQIYKMIPTIISRCQRFDFRRLTLPEIMKKLERISEKEKVKIERAALEFIALNAEGSFRDAESLFDQVLTFSGQKKEIKSEDIKNLLGFIETRKVVEFTDFILKKDAPGAFQFLSEIREGGVNLQQFAKAFIEYLRKTLIFKTVGEENPAIAGLTKEEEKKLGEQAVSFKKDQLKKVLETFLEAENKMRYSSIPQLPLELAIIEVCGVV